MKISFTICSLNYFAKALSLGESLQKTNPQYHFVIGLVDKVSEIYKSENQELISLVEKSNIIEIDKLGIPEFNYFCAKYNITELNTAVKPFFFDYFFQNIENLESVVYFDPDILVYSGLNELDKQLESYNFVITPHILSPIPDDELELNEQQINNTGLYNLGFIGIKKSEESQRFINWWKERLYKYCYVRLDEGLFVDQIWVNFLPLFFEKTRIERDLGYNVAYWNLHERMIGCKNNQYTINSNKTNLKFYHFSGFQLDKPDIVSKYQNRFDFENRKDIQPLFDDYISLLNKYQDEQFIKLKCYYSQKNMNKEFKSAVGAVVCDCETYIQEWCCFQYLTGFDKIIICLDRCTDNTRERIEGLPPQVRAKVDVFDNSPHDPKEGFQYRGYRHIYERYKGKVEWLAMFDDDEYLYDSQMRKINEMLDTVPDNVSQIVLPWINFTHSGKVLSATPDITRLKHCTKKENRNLIECKVIVRLDDIAHNEVPSGWYHCHYADVSGEEIMFDGKESMRFDHLPTMVVAEHFDTCLAHYIHGSMEDWVKKYKKWKIAQDTLGVPIAWEDYDYKRFDEEHIEDTRMVQYADELINLLKQCK